MIRPKMILVAALVAASLPLMSGHGQEKQKGNGLMQRKLVCSQRILEGIALSDFDKISQNGLELMAISKEAEWKAIKTAAYELHSNEFRRIVSEVVDKAKAKNLEGATLAYVDMTLACVKCHKYVREVRMTRLELAPLGEARLAGRGTR